MAVPARAVPSHRSSSSKILLFFVLRDHTQETPLSAMTATLQSDMHAMWQDIRKVPLVRARQCIALLMRPACSVCTLARSPPRAPARPPSPSGTGPARAWPTTGAPLQPEALAGRQLSDCFDLAFTSLPHMDLQRSAFDEATTALRRRFTDRTAEDFAFRAEYRKNIPADGFIAYAERIWVRPWRRGAVPASQRALSRC